MRVTLHTAQPGLFDDAADVLPPGLVFVPEFITAAEEAVLLQLLRALPMQHARYHDYTARRRVHTFGADDARPYTPQRHAVLPPPVQALRERLAAWAGVAPAALAQVMVSEYATGTPLGWHRDAPHYELIVGVSLGGAAQLRFKPWQGDGRIVGLHLQPRSAYLMREQARWGWQHSVPPVPAPRWSITMRTLRPLTMTR